MQITLQLPAGSDDDTSSPRSIPNSIHTKIPTAMETHKWGDDEAHFPWQLCTAMFYVEGYICILYTVLYTQIFAVYF